MSAFESDHSSVVARIQLGKPLLQPREASQALYISAVLSYELFGTLPNSNVLSTCELRACLLAESESEKEHNVETSIGIDHSVDRFDFERTTIKDNKAHFKLCPPLPAGLYSLCVWPEASPPGYYVLPLTIKHVEVCTVLPLRQDICCVTYRYLPVLACPLSHCDEKVLVDAGVTPAFSGRVDKIMTPWRGEHRWGGLVIKEERGLTMGSHVWDSAVVVSRHLPALLSALNPISSGRRLAVELGAGVGLVGMQLALTGQYSTVLLTDLPCQVPQTRENIFLNEHLWTPREGDTVTVKAAELDWRSEESVALFRSHQLAGRPVDLITAADVLYSSELAAAFFAVVKLLATPRHTTVLLAQKVRGEEASVDVSTVPGFRATQLLDQCGVLVFELVVV